MRHDHLKRELDLILLLVQNRRRSVEEICQQTGISRRSFYYYIHFFEQAGFKVDKQQGYYSIDRSSAFFKTLFSMVSITEDEALLIRRLVENAGLTTPRHKALYQKLQSFYDFRIMENEAIDSHVTHMRSMLYDAIKNHMSVELIGYSSPSSHTVSNRLVEPFAFVNDNSDVRCYEPSTGMNKTFRLSRMQDVEILDSEWQHESEHRQLFMDLFSFSGEQTMHVSMVMGQLSHNLMLEEYPHSAPCFTQTADGRWMFETDVCSYLGIGRFVIGLYDDIELRGDEGLKHHISAMIERWHNKQNT